jgi:uncharacterized protein (TIGR02449 family)
MPESELLNLETKLESFLQSYQQLRVENNSLRNKLALVAHENAVLLDRKRKAVNILRKIIIQLKDELACHKK